jgi:hypothetical protein
MLIHSKESRRVIYVCDFKFHGRLYLRKGILPNAAYKIRQILNSSFFWNIKSCSPFKSQPTFQRSFICTCFKLFSCLAYSSTLKMQGIYSSETSVDFQRFTWRYIPEERTHHTHRCESIKSYTSVILHFMFHILSKVSGWTLKINMPRESHKQKWVVVGSQTSY